MGTDAETIQGLLQQQVRYYDDRAEEFEDCYYRRGAHDMGPEFNRTYFEETAKLEGFVTDLPIGGRVLELACGTGLWTRWLVPKANHLLALDASEKMLQINRSRFAKDRVSHVRADLFGWEPAAGSTFDAIFIGFFLSHIPAGMFEGFWSKLKRWLAPDGFVAFCDDRDGPDRPYSGDVVPDGPSFAHRRTLSGGREYTIIKIFYSPEELDDTIGRLGWAAEVRSMGQHFLYGTARPTR
jgi:SAM-dependent methyltransferase